jgi:hypothetical protein
MTEPSTTAPPEFPYGLRWGIKRSFIDYVRRMPDGRGWVGDGATPLGSHEIVYAPEAAEPGDGGGARSWTFRGDVRFSGHAGMLFVQVAAPILTLLDGLDGTARLTVATPAGSAGPERLPLVTLRLRREPAPDGIEVWSGKDVRLTESGTALFDDVYPAGEPFDPLTVRLPAGAVGMVPRHPAALFTSTISHVSYEHRCGGMRERT